VKSLPRVVRLGNEAPEESGRYTWRQLCSSTASRQRSQCGCCESRRCGWSLDRCTTSRLAATVRRTLDAADLEAGVREAPLPSVLFCSARASHSQLLGCQHMHRCCLDCIGSSSSPHTEHRWQQQQQQQQPQQQQPYAMPARVRADELGLLVRSCRPCFCLLLRRPGACSCRELKQCRDCFPAAVPGRSVRQHVTGHLEAAEAGSSRQPLQGRRSHPPGHPS